MLMCIDKLQAAIQRLNKPCADAACPTAGGISGLASDNDAFPLASGTQKVPNSTMCSYRSLR